MVWDKSQENAEDKPLLCKGVPVEGKCREKKALEEITISAPRSEPQLLGKRLFGGLMMLVLVSRRAGCFGTMGVKCWGGRAILLLACDSTLLTSILCM